MSDSLLVSIVIRQLDEKPVVWTVELLVGGAIIPTGIRAPGDAAAARMIAARLAGTAP